MSHRYRCYCCYCCFPGDYRNFRFQVQTQIQMNLRLRHWGLVLLAAFPGYLSSRCLSYNAGRYHARAATPQYIDHGTSDRMEALLLLHRSGPHPCKYYTRREARCLENPVESQQRQPFCDRHASSVELRLPLERPVPGRCL